MTTDKYLAFQSTARTFLREATAAADQDRTMRLIESPGGLEKFCFGWSSIDTRLGETTTEFVFRPMSQELHGFLKGPVHEVLREHYQASQFWLIHRKRHKGGQWKGCYEKIPWDEVRLDIGQQLVVFDGGQAWMYLSDDGSTVGLAQAAAQKIKAR